MTACPTCAKRLTDEEIAGGCCQRCGELLDALSDDEFEEAEWLTS